MSFLKSPFLPFNDVTSVIANGLSVKSRDYLSDRKIEIISLPNNNSVDERIKYHTDVSCFVACDKMFLASEIKESIDIGQFKGFKIEFIKEKSGIKYPNDVLLNCVFLGDYLICNIDTVSKSVLEYFYNKQVINVKQGYTKCSVCPVNENSFITDDENIYLNCRDYFDVLFIKKGIVALNGFDYGFIGGASGKLNSDILAFTGYIYDEQVRNTIVDFCLNYGVKCLWLSDEQIYDVGGIIPLTEVDL